MYWWIYLKRASSLKSIKFHCSNRGTFIHRCVATHLRSLMIFVSAPVCLSIWWRTGCGVVGPPWSSKTRRRMHMPFQSEFAMFAALWFCLEAGAASLHILADGSCYLVQHVSGKKHYLAIRNCEAQPSNRYPSYWVWPYTCTGKHFIHLAEQILHLTSAPHDSIGPSKLWKSALIFMYFT